MIIYNSHTYTQECECKTYLYMGNYVKTGWDNIKNGLNEISSIYSLTDTINLLKTQYYYKDYFGRAKNRTMIKENPKLYKSIYTHSKILEDILKNEGRYKGWYNFKYRMIFLVEKSADIEQLRCECGTTYNWTRYCRKCPEPKKTHLGKTHSPESKLKMRVSTLSYLTKTKGQVIPRYNHSSIPIIEAKAKELGITDLQHAENGGEYHIKELGYWVDGYSKEHNIVIEYDEKHHFDKNGNLKEADLNRQSEIQNFLNCEFIRITDD